MGVTICCSSSDLDEDEFKRALEWANYRKRKELVCKKPFYQVTATTRIPSLAAMIKQSMAQLCELRPVKVHFDESFSVFGMTMSDGQKVIGGAEH